VTGWIDAAISWLRSWWRSGGDPVVPDTAIGVDSAGARGNAATHWSAKNPTAEALRGGQSPGLGLASGFDLDLGVMRPDLTLATFASYGIPGRVAATTPEYPGSPGSLLVALQAGDARSDRRWP
jgi:hypothetical protein